MSGEDFEMFINNCIIDDYEGLDDIAFSLDTLMGALAKCCDEQYCSELIIETNYENKGVKGKIKCTFEIEEVK